MGGGMGAWQACVQTPFPFAMGVWKARFQTAYEKEPWDVKSNNGN